MNKNYKYHNCLLQSYYDYDFSLSNIADIQVEIFEPNANSDKAHSKYCLYHGNTSYFTNP